MVDPIQIACRACAAQPGHGCDYRYDSPVTGLPVHAISPITFHQERVLDAAGWDDGGKKNDPDIVKEAIDKAVEDIL